VWLLNWFDGQLHARVLVKLSFEIECGSVGICSLQKSGEFQCDFTARRIVDLERREIRRKDPRDEPHLQPAVDHLVRDCQFFHKTKGVMEWDNMTHSAQAYLLGSRARRNRKQLRRRHQAFVRTKMMLDAKAVVEAELIA
jgi:hypothetical protein